MSFFIETLIFFAVFLFLRAVETRFDASRLKMSDQTVLVKSRLSPEVASLLEKSGMRVIRINQEQRMVAQTRLIVPRTAIFIDYLEYSVSRDLEDFLIAHEIAHVRGHHILLNMLFDCAFLSSLTSLGLVLTVGNPSFWNGALIGVSLIIAGVLLGFAPLSYGIIWLQEYNADAFAARYVGVESAFKQLEMLQTMIPASWNSSQKNLAARAKRMSARLSPRMG